MKRLYYKWYFSTDGYDKKTRHRAMIRDAAIASAPIAAVASVVGLFR